jgi:hypothetical protein
MSIMADTQVTDAERKVLAAASAYAMLYAGGKPQTPRTRYPWVRRARTRDQKHEEDLLGQLVSAVHQLQRVRNLRP